MKYSTVLESWGGYTSTSLRVTQWVTQGDQSFFVRAIAKSYSFNFDGDGNKSY